MAIKLADTLAPMADFPAAMAEHVEFADGENLQKKLDDGSLGGGVTYIELSQEEYDALSDEEKNNGSEYRTYDTGNIYKNGVLYGGKEPVECTFEEYKQLEADGLVDPDTDYIIVSDESGILLASTDVAYDSTKTVKGKFDELDELLTDGANFYSPAPIGTVLSFAGHVAPNGYLLCDGASYKRYDYPDLYAVIGNTYGGDDVNFNVPDYRETVLVGVGENTTDTITSHDVYGLGEFKDDQFQGHWHNLGNLNGTVTVALGASIKGGSVQGANPGSENRYTVDLALDAITDGANGEPRKGTTTHGKQKGVTYIIKAKHTNEGTDSGVSDDVVNYVALELKTSSNVDVTYVTLTGDSTFESMGDTYCKYQVKNGICYFQFFVSTTVDTDIFTEIYNGLPKPTFSQYFSYSVYYNSQGLNKTLQVNISEDGLLTAANTLPNSSYMIAGSYPIA